jgi:hypothetical protein
MIAAELLAVAVGGCAVGFLLVEYLTVHPLVVGRTMLLWCAALFGTVVLVAVRFTSSMLVVASAVALAGLVVGYLLRARSVLARRDPRIVPDLEPPGLAEGSGHTAVVYFTHGEPETYDPIGWINQFREFEEDGIRFVPFAVRPIFIYRLRQSYLKAGRSNHRQMHCRMCRLLEERLREAGHDCVRAYVSFLDDDPRPDAALIQAINDGASRIVVAEVFTTVSNHTAKGKQLIAAVPTAELGIEVIHTCPLWDSATLHRMFLDKVEAATGDTDRSKVGVLLVGYGQPAEWDREFATETEQEIAFRQSVLDLLAEHGYAPGNLSMAWMMFKSPRPVEKVEDLVARGVEKILYFSAAISADALSSQCHVPEMIQRARVPGHVELVNLGAWDDHDLSIEAIFERVEPLLERKDPVVPGFRSACDADLSRSDSEHLIAEET